MEKRFKLKELDSLEILTSKNSKHEFPKHFHETYAISLIENGVFGENQFIGTKGSILISHPNEMHENKLISNNSYTFTTLYVSPDVIKYISSKPNIFFIDKIIHNQNLYQQFKTIIDNLEVEDFDRVVSIHEALEKLIVEYGRPVELDEAPQLSCIKDVQQYIVQNYHTKIKLEDLAFISKLNKFQFIRQFKKHVGITPFEYLNIQRVSGSKQLLHDGVPIINAALESGFYDQSHFSKYFKRFVGLSPMQYLYSCNILQDFNDLLL